MKKKNRWSFHSKTKTEKLSNSPVEADGMLGYVTQTTTSAGSTNVVIQFNVNATEAMVIYLDWIQGQHIVKNVSTKLLTSW